MLSVLRPESLPNVTLQWSLMHFAFSLLFPLSGITTWYFALDSAVLNAALTYYAYEFKKDPTDQKSRALFFATLRYLALFMLLMLIHAASPNQDDEAAKSKEAQPQMSSQSQIQIVEKETKDRRQQ